MKSRLESLERIVAALQTRPPDEAEHLLNRIRSADDLDTVILPRDHASATGSSYASSSSNGSSSHRSDGANTMLTSRSDSDHLRMNPSAYLVTLLIPNKETTALALESFFSSSGKLFHVFSRDQTFSYYKSVFNFGLDGRANINNRVALCSLASVAAVGIQYNPADFEKGSEVLFYDVARHYFAHVVEEHPLDAIKVCTMLAMYNILSKATVTLAYVGRSCASRLLVGDQSLIILV